MRKILLIAIFTLHTSHADTIGGEVSMGLFNHSPSGYASYTSPFQNIGTEADLEDSFGFSDEQDIFFKAYFEHPFPGLPNLKLGYTTLSHSGNNDVTLFSWGDIVNITGEIENTLELDFLDATLYYELLDNWTEVDIGLTFRYINGDMGVSTSILSDTLNFSTLTPLIYGKFRFNIPNTDFSVQLEANGISYSGFSSYDYELSTRYTFTMGLGLEAGYKTFQLDSDDLVRNLDADIDFSGLYAAAVWNF